MKATKQDADYLTARQMATAALMKRIIKGRVSTLVANLAGLLGEANTRKDAFWRKQAKTSDDLGKNAVLPRADAVIYSAFLADPYGDGEELLSHIEELIGDLRRMRDGGTRQPVKGDFWSVEKHRAALSTERVAALAAGDKQTARRISGEILLAEKSMPHFLKRNESRRRSKQVKKTAKKSVKRVKNYAAR